MKKYKKVLFLIGIIIGTGILIISTFTLAKYISNSILEYYLNSKGFYFSSDYLKVDKTDNVNNLWDGGRVYFNIKNGINEDVVTSYDINYKAECTIISDAKDHAECHINGTSSNIYEGTLSNFQICKNNKDDGVDVSSLEKTDCELQGYEWINQISVKELYFDINLTDSNYELSDIVVNVIVTSISPYKRTLKGDFILHKNEDKEEEISIKYDHYENYDRLIILNSYHTQKCVKIIWNSDNLLIDVDHNEILDYWTDEDDYINAIKLKINSQNNASYIFYKRNPNNVYNANDFEIEEIIDC